MTGGPVVRVIALGSRTECDDEAALRVTESLAESLGERARVVLAGRPGPGLLDLLQPPQVPTVIVDVMVTGQPPGRVLVLALHELPDAVVAGRPVSSHGFGPAEALQLAVSLGRPLPDGWFVGIEGAQFTPGAGLHPGVREGLAALRQQVLAAVQQLGSTSATRRSPGTDR